MLQVEGIEYVTGEDVRDTEVQISGGFFVHIPVLQLTTSSREEA